MGTCTLGQLMQVLGAGHRSMGRLDVLVSCNRCNDITQRPGSPKAGRVFHVKRADRLIDLT